MPITTQKSKPKTYIPNDNDQAQFTNIIKYLEDQLRSARPTLSDGNGQVIELPEQLFDVLRQVAEVLADGRGVTVIPQESRLTTQSAADFMGVSRPTLIKILESGNLAYETVGRHRRVMLRDLVEYMNQFRVERRSTLQQIARAGQEAGMLDVTFEDSSETK
ncbi:MAG: excisionase family DNA-binding protein [Actinomycetota bacterium]|nr:excisionase family DNA-binding protein [Actinomycetota bacterium]